MKCTNCQVQLIQIFSDLKMCPKCRDYVCAWEIKTIRPENSDLKWLEKPSFNPFSHSNIQEPSVDLDPADDL